MDFVQGIIVCIGHSKVFVKHKNENSFHKKLIMNSLQSHVKAITNKCKEAMLA